MRELSSERRFSMVTNVTGRTVEAGNLRLRRRQKRRNGGVIVFEPNKIDEDTDTTPENVRQPIR
jgi:hypothetical protein